MTNYRNTDGDAFEPSEDAYDWDAHIRPTPNPQVKVSRDDDGTTRIAIDMSEVQQPIHHDPDTGPVAAAAYIALAIVAVALTALLIGLYYAPLWVLNFVLTVLAVLTALRMERWIKGE